MRLCIYHTEDCENEGTLYCHERRAWYCQSCAESEFPQCAGIGCHELDIEGDFEQDANGEYLCPDCMADLQAHIEHQEYLEAWLWSERK